MDNYFLLKHNDIEVATLKLNEDYRVIEVLNINNFNHLPNYIKIKEKQDNITFDDWLQNRYISPSRKGVKDLMKVLNIDSPIKLLIENNALSLTDHYWICKKNEDKLWKNINYFENVYSEDVGKFLVGNFKGIINSITPEGTSRGALQKYWEIDGNDRYLIKGGIKPFYQEPINEIISSKILKHLGIEHTEYKKKIIGDKLYSKCKNYLGSNNEEVLAWEINSLYNNDKIYSYDNYIKCLESIGLKNEKDYINKMIFIDYLIGNTDRHGENYGVMRDAKSLEYKKIIPIFDFGNSLYHNEEIINIIYDDPVNSILFNKSNEENMENITDYNWLDKIKLNELPDLVKKELKDLQLSDDRKKMIVNVINNRVKNINKIVQI